ARGEVAPMEFMFVRISSATRDGFIEVQQHAGDGRPRGPLDEIRIRLGGAGNVLRLEFASFEALSLRSVKLDDLPQFKIGGRPGEAAPEDESRLFARACLDGGGPVAEG